jgi:hypothetical protein
VDRPPIAGTAAKSVLGRPAYVRVALLSWLPSNVPIRPPSPCARGDIAPFGHTQNCLSAPQHFPFEFQVVKEVLVRHVWGH